MEILLLDDCFVYDKCDPFIAGLAEWGHVVFFQSLSDREKRSAMLAAEALLTNQAAVDAGLIDRMPKLRYIGLMATGYNHVDMQAARRRGIAVTHVPAYSSESVAQGVFAHILNIYNRVAKIDQQVRNRVWLDFGQEEYWKNPVWELNRKVLGIVGLGNIGMTVARIGACGFGMRVLAYTSKKAEELPYGIESVDLKTVFSTGDIVSLHCPLDATTRHLVNADTLAWMKPSAVLINTGRGGLVDEPALFKALSQGTLAAAGLDVLENEPPSADNPLLELENCFFTAHNCFATKEARARLLEACCRNLEAFVCGRSLNRVD